MFMKTNYKKLVKSLIFSVTIHISIHPLNHLYLKAIQEMSMRLQLATHNICFFS